MKIARFTEGGRTRLGIVDTTTDEIIDVGRQTHAPTIRLCFYRRHGIVDAPPPPLLDWL